MNALALDPGRTTGYAQGLIKDGVMLVVTGQRKMNQSEFMFLLTESAPDYIICESFEFRHGIHRHHGADMYSRELIGIVNLYVQMNVPNVELKMQQPMKDSPTTFFKNSRLKEMGIYKPGNDHANDAARHLCYWAKFKSGSQFVKEIKQGVLS
jgi:hypothetical protein